MPTRAPCRWWRVEQRPVGGGLLACFVTGRAVAALRSPRARHATARVRKCSPRCSGPPPELDARAECDWTPSPTARRPGRPDGPRDVVRTVACSAGPRGSSHRAGTKTATLERLMDGAIQAGERPADEVYGSLSGAPAPVSGAGLEVPCSHAKKTGTAGQRPETTPAETKPWGRSSARNRQACRRKGAMAAEPGVPGIGIDTAIRHGSSVQSAARGGRPSTPLTCWSERCGPSAKHLGDRRAGRHRGGGRLRRLQVARGMPEPPRARSSRLR